jgi:predicted esterase
MTRRGFLLAALVLVLLVGATARAEEEEDPRARFMTLAREVQAHFAAKEYEKAEEGCREMIAIAPDQPTPHYNLACALSRLGRTTEALEALERAVERGFTDADHMRGDPDLKVLHQAAGFAGIVEAAESARKAAIEKLYEPGEDLEGVRTVEGNPENGLRWRVRIAKDASGKKVQRLVIWLHPSGGSMNEVAERLAPVLAKHGYALLVPTKHGYALLVPTAKQWMSWSAEEAKTLLEVTLPDAAKKVEGLDVSRPVLMGYSAGGQMALSLWVEDASRFSGLVLDAAYPIDPAAYRQRRIVPLEIPEGDGPTRCAIFVLVGTADQGHQVWKQVEEPWREAGIPLTVHYVEGGRHAWLLGAEQKEELLAWLDGLAPKKEAPAEKD